jgi:hypothetical protein
MAPELQRGDSASAGPSADVYALGALLFWLHAPGEKTLPVIAPRRLRAIAEKCVAASSADRYATAAALTVDLARYRAGLPVSAHRDTLLERAGLWFSKYQTLVWLIVAYLVMRALFAFLQRTP